MQEIRCPKCGEVFQVDATGYEQIVRQVRDQEFTNELERREKEFESKQKKELELIRLQEEKDYDANIAKKDAEISALDRKIAELQAKLDAGETAKKLAVAEAVNMLNLKIISYETSTNQRWQELPVTIHSCHIPFLFVGLCP